MEATIPVVDRQLVVVVEGTAALGPHWNTIFFDYLEKIIRSFCGNETPPEKPQDSRPELGLVMFYAHGPYSEGDVQQTIWIKDTDKFLQMLKGLRFNGGGFSDSCVTEGLAEALLMFGVNSNGNHSQPRPDCHKHCILVAASNPYPLKTYIYKYIPQNTETRKNVSVPMEAYLSDAVMVAKRFSQFPYSLSIISARHLPKLQEVYNAGKHNPQAVDRPVTDKKNPYFLVLISDNFVEASNALSRPAVKLQPSQGIINVDGPSGSPNVSAISATMKNRHTVPVGHSPVDMVEVEPAVSGFCHPSPIMNATTQGGSSLPSSTPSPVRQEMNTNPESVQEFKPVINPISQTLRPVGPAAANMNILNNLSQHSHARQVINSASIGGGTSMGVKPMAIHMSNMISNGMVSSALSGMQSIPTSGALIETSQAAQNTAMGSLVTTNNSNIAGKSNISLPNLQQVNVGMGQSLPPNVGQASLNSASQFGQNAISINQSALNNSLSTSNISSGAGTMMPTPGMSQSTQSGLNYLDATNGSTMNMPSQQNAPGSQQPQSKYTKIWVGALSGQRQGQPVFICKLEGYRSTTASDKLADDWPEAMQIVRLISQDHMNNKQYVGKADLLVFRPLNPHGFLGQLHDKKLCAVIQLPSQTLLLSVIDRMTRLIGMLFPGDMVVFKPQASNQPQLQLQQQQNQNQQQQQNQNQQQQQIQQQNQSQQNQQQQQQQRSQMIGVGLNQSFVQGPTRTQLMSQQQGQGNMQGQGNIQGQGNMQGQGNLQAQGTMQGGNFLP